MTASNRAPFTPEATIGPFFPFPFTEERRWSALPSPGVPLRPAGRPVVLSGRIVDCHGAGIRNMLLESWQANAHGRYRHPDDGGTAALDPAFDGFARVRTDADGGYRLETIKPGAHHGTGGTVTGETVTRAPHLRFTIFGSGIDRLVTFAFFEDEPLNDGDPLLLSLDPPERSRLIARRATTDDTGGFAGYRLDIVLRGAAETPFFDDWQD